MANGAAGAYVWRSCGHHHAGCAVDTSQDLERVKISRIPAPSQQPAPTGAPGSAKWPTRKGTDATRTAGPLTP